ncbi:MAG: SidE phosphodiesterase domain-containing protein [Legionellales bacterium]
MSKSRYESKKPAYQTKQAHYSQPPMGSVAVFEWETFRPLTDYSEQSMVGVFKRISRDIIERPYHYDQHKAFDAQGTPLHYNFTRADNVNPPAKVPGVAVYKQNHGTGHAIRQMIYTDVLIDKIAKAGNQQGQQIAQIVNNTPAIASILKLAAYCKRIGRTFDHEHDDPGYTTIYSKRSSEMFAKMAEELGYGKDLILVISESMLEPKQSPSAGVMSKNIAGISGVDLRDFSESVLMAAHMADLARLFSVRRSYITTAISGYFEPKQLLPVATELVEMACKANTMTGNPVVAQENGVKHQTVNVNGKKLVAVVNDIATAVSELKTLSLLPPSQKAQIDLTSVRLMTQNRKSSQGACYEMSCKTKEQVQHVQVQLQKQNISIHEMNYFNGYWRVKFDNSILAEQVATQIIGKPAFDEQKPKSSPAIGAPQVNGASQAPKSSPANGASQANGAQVISPLVLKKQEKQMLILLDKLALTVKELAGKVKTNPKDYGPVARELRQLHTTLINEKANFFQKPTAAGLKQYSDHCNQAIDSLKEAKNHRGWHKVDPILRAIVGVLAFCVSFIFEVSSKNGYVGTFFKTPETDTAKKTNDFKARFQSEINEIDAVISAGNPPVRF